MVSLVADHRPQAHHRVVAVRVRQALRHYWQLERPRHIEHVRLSHPVRFRGPLRPLQQLRGHMLVEPRDNDRDREFCTVERPFLHHSAAIIRPGLVRFVR